MRQPKRVTWRVLLSTVLWIVGIGFVLLLNGQFFTNTIGFIVCIVTSALVWLPVVFDTANRRRVTAIMAIHVFFLSVAIVFLPRTYKWQQQFDMEQEQIMELRRTYQPPSSRKGKDMNRGKRKIEK